MTLAAANTSPVLKNKLEQRANLYRTIRAFFYRRNVLEVETQLLSQFGVTDLHIQNIPAGLMQKDEMRGKENCFLRQSEKRYLQSSPEYAMKRLLVDGSGDIYQICKAFRQGEAGHKHNPEFTMLEWYRVGFTHIELMDEMDDLLQVILITDKADRYTYQQLFQHYLGFDPLNITTEALHAQLHKNNITLNTPLDAVNLRDTLLDLLVSHCIEPKLGLTKPAFVYNYPASQAALAKINGDIAERFEVYYKGVELANGFHELTDAKEQLARFETDNQKRKAMGLNEMPIDTNFITALEKGLPNCAGVALGIDRLLMLMRNTTSIKDVIAYTWDVA